MYKTKTHIKNILIVLIILSTLIGLGLDIILSKNMVAVLRLFTYFTIQSNLFVLLAMVFVIYYKTKKREQPKLISLFIISSGFWITLTGLAYHFLLSSFLNLTGLHAVANLLLHYVTPVGMVLFLLIFHLNKETNKYVPLYSTLYPLLYCLVTMIRGSFDGYYPYWFLNPQGAYPKGNESIGNVLMYILTLSVAFLIVGYLLLIIKRGLEFARKLLTAN